MNREEKRNAYFFACGFTWWVIHIFFRPYEHTPYLLEDDLLDRLDELREKAEEPAIWLTDELLKTDVSFIKDGGKVTIYKCLAGYEREYLAWIKDIFDVARARSDNNKEYEYLYYLQIGWVLHILNALEAYLVSLEVPDYEESYLQEKQIFDELKSWLNEELRTAAPQFLGKAKEEVMDEQVRQLYKSLEDKWRQAVVEAVYKFAPR